MAELSFRTNFTGNLSISLWSILCINSLCCIVSHHGHSYILGLSFLSKWVSRQTGFYIAYPGRWLSCRSAELQARKNTVWAVLKSAVTNNETVTLWGRCFCSTQKLEKAKKLESCKAQTHGDLCRISALHCFYNFVGAVGERSLTSMSS